MPFTFLRTPRHLFAVALCLCLIAVGTWLLNPFAALLLALPVNCWMLASIGETRPASRAWLAAIGLVPAVIVAVAYMSQLSMGPLSSRALIASHCTNAFGPAAQKPTAKSCRPFSE